MSSPTQAGHSVTISEFVRQVEESCRDLPELQRRHLIADLETHLHERDGQQDLLAELGDPADYARELRAALELPAPPRQAEHDSAKRRPVRLVLLFAALAVLAALAVIVAVFALPAATDSNQPSLAPSMIPTTAGSAFSQVPNVVGTSEAVATAEMLAVGLEFEARTVRSSAPAGQVVAQNPVALATVATGSTIVLLVSTGP
jgi:uncharacterized membrane protein